MIWKVVDNQDFDNIIWQNLNNKHTKFTCCDNPQGHIYVHKWSERFSSAWGWCSNCGTYSHLDGVKPPSNWNNPQFIDEKKLVTNPQYLEENKEEIDKLFN